MLEVTKQPGMVVEVMNRKGSYVHVLAGVVADLLASV